MDINNNTFIVQLTVEDLIRILKENFPILSESMRDTGKKVATAGPTFSGRIMFGLSGIQSFFSVSHKTAQAWKNTWLAPAVIQNGRKIIVDADYALTLFQARKE